MTEPREQAEEAVRIALNAQYSEWKDDLYNAAAIAIDAAYPIIREAEYDNGTQRVENIQQTVKRQRAELAMLHNQATSFRTHIKQLQKEIEQCTKNMQQLHESLVRARNMTEVTERVIGEVEASIESLSWAPLATKDLRLTLEAYHTKRMEIEKHLGAVLKSVKENCDN